MLINVKKLNKSFIINNEKHQILNDLSLAVDNNQIVSLYGASGSGKSTLLNILSGLMSYDSGQINFNNQLIDESFDYVNFRRNDIGIIFQEDQLLSEFNVIENIMLPSIISGNSKKIAYDLAYKLLENFSLLNIKNSYSNILSGGEKQRVSILRAIINKPKFIIADEPTGSIDENNKDKIFTLFKDIISQYDTSILIATHDNNVSKIIWVSSSTVYQPSKKKISEKKINFNYNPYPDYLITGNVYRFLENIVNFYKSKGVDVCVVRTSSIYGPYDNFNPKKSHVIPALIKKIFDTKKNEIKIWGNPNVVRDFVYVDDLAKAIVLLMNKKVTEPINFSYGKGLTIISLAKILIKLSGKKIKFKFINPKLSSAPYRVLENKLFNRIFKKFKRTGIEDGLKKTINWYLNGRKKF